MAAGLTCICVHVCVRVRVHVSVCVCLCVCTCMCFCEPTHVTVYVCTPCLFSCVPLCLVTVPSQYHQRTHAKAFLHFFAV